MTEVGKKKVRYLIEPGDAGSMTSKKKKKEYIFTVDGSFFAVSLYDC